MARVEERHWWYLGLRDALGRTLARLDLPSGPRILDAGCGTGANLAMLADRFRPSLLAGFDLAPEAIAIARAKAPSAELRVADITDPEPLPRELDLVVSLDVLSSPGLDRARRGLVALVGALRPGGLFAVNLPAYRWLYSAHDVAVHMTERYTLRGVRDAFGALGLVPERASYRLCLLFPLVVLGRLPSLVGGLPSQQAARSDLHRMPGPTLHRLLHGALRLENAWIARGGRWPWGSSVFAVFRKR
jgi:SAM-dependent methyltransferase